MLDYNKEEAYGAEQTKLQKKIKETGGSGNSCRFGGSESCDMVSVPCEAGGIRRMGRNHRRWDFIMVPDWIERDLIPVNPYSRSGELLSSIDGIVVHYTANPGTTAKQNRNYFAGLADGSGTSASSHFIIDTDGTILQCVPMSEIAYASNDRNRDTLSIECCHEDESGKFTKETYQSLVKLTAWLCDTYGLETDQVIRHYDVTGKLCPKYYVEHEDKWDTLKKDIEKAR